MKGECVIIDYVRTSLCSVCGKLGSRNVSELAQGTMEAVMQRTKLAASQLDHVIFGHAHMDTNPYNLARTAWLLTRLDENVPGYTVNACGASGLLALQRAYQLILTGNDLTILCGGAESYTNAPYILHNARYRMDLSRFPIVDSITEGELWTQPKPLDPHMLADSLAEQNGYDAEQIEALVSSERSRADASLWSTNLVPVCWIDRKKREVRVEEDSPDIPQHGFAAYSDGAAAMLVADAARAEELQLKPLAKVIGFSIAADAPEKRWSSVLEAVRKLMLKYPSIHINNIAAVELVAESAATMLAVENGLKDLGFAENTVNRSGSSLFYGVNEGADGVIAAGRCLLNLKRYGGRYGLVTAAVAGGQAIAMLMEIM